MKLWQKVIIGLILGIFFGYMMNAGGERIAYNLYADPAHHVPLTLTQPLQLVVPASGVTTAIPIYGGVPHIGDPYAGLYTDVVWLTLSY